MTGNSREEPLALQCAISSERIDDGWDAFVEQCPGGHYEQTTAWGTAKRVQGWQPVRLILSRGRDLVGGALILTRALKGVLSVGYVSRGPLYAEDDPALRRSVLEALDRWARAGRLAYFVVVPPYTGSSLAPDLLRLGFRIKPDALPPSGLVTATTLIDLAGNEDAILSRMSASTRHHIRRGLRGGMTVRFGDAGDIEKFQRLLLQLCERRRVSPMPSQPDFFAKLWQAQGHRGSARLFIAEYQGEPVAGNLGFALGDALRLWKTGWSGEHTKLYPNAVLNWECIRWARDNGFRYVDLVQIIPDHAKALLRGEAVTGPYAGVTLFKMAFGGSVTLLPEPYYSSYQPLIRGLLHVGGARLIESPRVLGLASKLLRYDSD